MPERVKPRKVEELVTELKQDKSITRVTHSMVQAGRVTDRVAVVHRGRMAAHGPTAEVFERPATSEACGFIGGQVG